MQTITYLSFDKWMKDTNASMISKIGLSSEDLPDQTYRDWFDDEIMPEDAANMAVENMLRDDGIFTPADIIYAYTRAQAIEDGFTVDANIGDFAEVSKQHYKFPLYMTRHLFNLIETAVNNPKWCNDFRGVWHDILWMSKKAIDSRPSPDTVLFRVIIRGTKEQATEEQETYNLKAVCEATDIDNPAPCVTFMLAGED